jgi:hypothetical protein
MMGRVRHALHDHGTAGEQTLRVLPRLRAWRAPTGNAGPRRRCQWRALALLEDDPLVALWTPRPPGFTPTHPPARCLPRFAPRRTLLVRNVSVAPASQPALARAPRPRRVLLVSRRRPRGAAFKAAPHGRAAWAPRIGFRGCVAKEPPSHAMLPPPPLLAAATRRVRTGRSGGRNPGCSARARDGWGGR